MYNANTPARPQMRPGSSGGPNMGYAPSPLPNQGGPGPYGMMHASSSTPGAGQKRKMEGDAPTNPHIPAGPGGPGGLGGSGGPSGGPSSAPTGTNGPGAGQPERKFRPPMPPPHLLASLVPESKMFKDLIETEQKLDWTMLRKRAEVNDALGRVVKVSLRALSNFAKQERLMLVRSCRSSEH